MSSSYGQMCMIVTGHYLFSHCLPTTTYKIRRKLKGWHSTRGIQLLSTRVITQYQGLSLRIRDCSFRSGLQIYVMAVARGCINCWRIENQKQIEWDRQMAKNFSVLMEVAKLIYYFLLFSYYNFQGTVELFLFKLRMLHDSFMIHS